MHLRYDLMEASLNHNENRHPQEVMQNLGINYKHSTPQSMGDQWWFWNCSEMPENMPSFITELKVDPIKCIGYGLSEEKAKEIKNEEIL